jgi:hypothetical protein
LPKCFENVPFTDRVHALPERFVAESHQLTVARQPFERFFLEVRCVVVDVIEDLGLQDKEGAVDPTFTGLGLFREFGNRVAVEFEVSEARRRADRRQRSVFAVRAMEG